MANGDAHYACRMILYQMPSLLSRYLFTEVKPCVHICMVLPIFAKTSNWRYNEMASLGSAHGLATIAGNYMANIFLKRIKKGTLIFKLKMAGIFYIIKRYMTIYIPVGILYLFTLIWYIYIYIYTLINIYIYIY